jgi:hypothetical protein
MFDGYFEHSGNVKVLPWQFESVMLVLLMRGIYEARP